ncbi:MAG: UTP--glucose-1-phosphate uridylyltransferase [Candidatus Nezhaarchaeales archaeon]
MIKKVVITAAGLGTRLLPITKEIPKEMLPICLDNSNGPTLKPLLQALFEQLYSFGFRDFCFVVGRGKRAIEDHFTPDWNFVNSLRSKGKLNIAEELENFYRMIESSRILFVNQPEPKGFGHAVLMAKPFVGKEPFMVCAGDTYIISTNNDFLKRLVSAFSDDVTAAILLQRVEDPWNYGVALVKPSNSLLLDIIEVVEKPKAPKSNIAIMPFYIFKPEIIGVLENLEPGVGNEYQLTDAIQKIIMMGRRVVGVLLEEDELRLDIGTPKTYIEALKVSYEYHRRRNYNVTY